MGRHPRPGLLVKDTSSLLHHNKSLRWAPPLPRDPSKVICVVLGVNGVDGDNGDERDDGESNNNAAAARVWHLFLSELEGWTDWIVLDLGLSWYCGIS